MQICWKGALKRVLQAARTMADYLMERMRTFLKQQERMASGIDTEPRLCKPDRCGVTGTFLLEHSGCADACCMTTNIAAPGSTAMVRRHIIEISLIGSRNHTVSRGGHDTCRRSNC